MLRLIDTNIAIHLRDGEPAIAKRFAAFDQMPLLSVVSRIELENGVYRSNVDSSQLRARLNLILSQLTELEFGAREADAYRDIVAAIGYARTRVFDRMIAAQAIATGATLVTINGSDFRDIPQLVLEEWPNPA